MALLNEHARSKPSLMRLDRKKNQMKGEIENKRKSKGDEVVRDMCVLATTFSMLPTKPLQTPSLLLTLLPIQSSLGSSIQRPRRHQFSLPHCTAQAGDALYDDGLPLRRVLSSHYRLRDGRTGKVGDEIPDSSKDSARRTMAEAEV